MLVAVQSGELKGKEEALNFNLRNLLPLFQASSHRPGAVRITSTL